MSSTLSALARRSVNSTLESRRNMKKHILQLAAILAVAASVFAGAGEIEVSVFPHPSGKLVHYLQHIPGPLEKIQRSLREIQKEQPETTVRISFRDDLATKELFTLVDVVSQAGFTNLVLVMHSAQPDTRTHLEYQIELKKRTEVSDNIVEGLGLEMVPEKRDSNQGIQPTK
jgi:hypothetical protein